MVRRVSVKVTAVLPVSLRGSRLLLSSPSYSLYLHMHGLKDKHMTTGRINQIAFVEKNESEDSEGRLPGANPVSSPPSSLPCVLRQSFNDPSAGSPTETLLRLLLPLNGRV